MASSEHYHPPPPTELDLVAAHRKILLDRIALLMEEQNMPMRQLSKLIGKDEGYISQLFNGRVEQPGHTVILSIAEALKCDLAFLLARTDTPRSLRPLQNIIEIEVVGIAESGAFRRVGSAMTKRNTVLGACSPRYPSSDHFALEVHDDSMNRARPALDVDMYALCVDMVAAEIDVQEGGIYAIKRTFDGGRTYETTIRKARAFNDRWEFVPESSNPIHETIVLPRREAPLDQQVTVIGKVYGSQSYYEE